MSKNIESPYTQTVDSVCQYFNVSLDEGLSDIQVLEHRAIYGKNELEQEEPKSILEMIMEQFEDTLVRILLAAAFVSFLLVFFDDKVESGLTAYVEPFVILLILIANAIVGIWQESNAEQALDALKRMQPEVARVLRNGKVSQIDAIDLVPGDVVEIRVGDKIPADIRLVTLKTTSLRSAEPQLTGESDPVDKFTEEISCFKEQLKPRDQHNMLFCTSTLVSGSGIGVVCYTGMNMEIGKIQKDVQTASEEDQTTPLSRKIDEFGELLTKVIAIICLVVFVINYKNFSDPHHGGLLRGCIYYFKIAVALAVAAIPEGLPAVITTCLALGTRKMAQKNVIVRRLPSVETLGCTTVVCSDKTGTLTCGKMNTTSFAVIRTESGLVDIFNVDGNWNGSTGTVTNANLNTRIKKVDINNDNRIDWLLKVCVSCNDAKIVPNTNDNEISIQNNSNDYICLGEPTEGALLGFAEKLYRCKKPEDNYSYLDGITELNTICGTKKAILEFSRTRKSMSVICQVQNTNENVLLVKGAPENLLDRSSYMLLSEDKIIKLSAQAKRNILKEINDMASRGLRTLGVCIKKDLGILSNYDGTTQHKGHMELINTSNYVNIENDLIFIGLIGITDPPRDEVKLSIQKCDNAGIRVIMITGDNKLTAEAIGKEIGILDEEDENRSFEGHEWEKLGETGQIELLKDLLSTEGGIVFSRTEPEHKLQIVKALKSLGEVTAMTGDGVNDASALKIADIGIAMGITGTEVAKESADMILANDDFSSIVVAVEEGRSIYNNMKAFIRYLISSNIGEVASIFLTAILGIPEGLVPVQLLWVNLVTDGFPAAALGFNPPDVDVMNKEPRGKDDALISSWVFFRYMIIGLYVGLATVGIFIYWFTIGIDINDVHDLVTFKQLSNWSKCTQWENFNVLKVYGMTDSCDYFSSGKIKASTLSLTVLVVIEMLNALNALSEDGSLVHMPPWRNVWLCLAITASVLVHFCVLYIPFLASIFNVVPLSLKDWFAVLAFSAPVIAIDEILKLCARIYNKTHRYKRIHPNPKHE